MKILIGESYEDISRKAALIVASHLILNPRLVLGLATGSTPIGIYKELVTMFKRGDIDFSQVTTFNLDEYCGLSREDENSYYFYMRKYLFNYLNIPAQQVHTLEGQAENIQDECLKYEQEINRAGGIDLQLLGIGTNGHIGFNEPNSKLSTVTHLVNLTQKTIRDNSRFFESVEDVPTRALSMGMGTIMKAKKILLIASGENKAKAIRGMTSGYLDPKVPASLLQAHGDITLILDREAASLIEKK